MLTYELNDLKKTWEKECDHYEYRSFRRGQMLFNIIHHRFPKVAASLVGTTLDPFFSDSRITECLRHLAYLAGENDIRLSVFGKEAEDERKEEEERPLEMAILQSIQKRMVKEDIPRTEGEMVEGSKDMERNL